MPSQLFPLCADLAHRDSVVGLRRSEEKVKRVDGGEEKD